MGSLLFYSLGYVHIAKPWSVLDLSGLHEDNTMPVLHYVTFYAQCGVCVALIGSLEECVGVAELRWPDRRCVIGAGLSLSAGRTASCVSGSDSVSADINQRINTADSSCLDKHWSIWSIATFSINGVR